MHLQCWALFLLEYQYDLEFRPTNQHTNADRFSHFPLDSTEETAAEKATEVAVLNVHLVQLLPVRAQQLRDHTFCDQVLSKVLQYTLSSWPHSEQVPVALKPFYQRQVELTVGAGCLLWGTRVIVPEKLQSQVLKELHTSHPGIVRMKALACAYAW